jgi:3-hydroxybutyryl-CoA dehydrogenase
VKIDELKSVAVVGAGSMGRQIALNTALHGYPVRLWDASAEQMKAARGWVDEYVAGRLEKSRWTSDQADQARRNLVFSDSLADACAEADLAIEAVVEDVEVKRAVFGDLDELCPPRTILATNSSTIVSSRLVDVTGRPDRVANMHYFNPAMVMEVVEVVQGPHTSAETAETLVEFCRRTGKKPIWMKREIDGFIANRLLGAVIREAGRLVDEGYATFEEVDLAAEKALGHPMGPFRLLDMTGIDVSYLVSQDRYKRSGREEDRPPRCIEDRVKAGHLGRKTGQGFYTYERR